MKPITGFAEVTNVRRDHDTYDDVQVTLSLGEEHQLWAKEEVTLNVPASRRLYPGDFVKLTIEAAERDPVAQQINEDYPA